MSFPIACGFLRGLSSFWGIKAVANYSFVDLTSKVTAASFEATLQQIVQERFEGRAKVVRPDYEAELGYTDVWHVEIPGTAQLEERAAMQRMLAPGEDIAISIQLEKGGMRIAFRGSPNQFESWLRGVVRERLALHYEATMFFDATDTREHPNRTSKDRHDYPSYGAYMTRNFDKPLSTEDEAWFARWKELAPEGWW